MRLSLFYFFYCILSLLSLPAMASWQRSVTNYTRHDYKAGNQNWMIAQHDNGWMYFANNKGLLEFDGDEWDTYSINNAKTRAVKAGNDGKIYVGGMGQFGYFVPNRLGGLDYVCLSDSISKQTDIGVIWNIHIAGGRVYFQSDRSIFYLENNKIKVIKYAYEIKYSAIIGNRFYIASKEGLLVLNGNDFSVLAGTEDIASFKVVGLLPLNNKILVVTGRNGLFLYDGVSMAKYASAADPFMQANQLFCAAIKDSFLALGSVQDGVLLLNHEKNRAEKISISNGLQNKTVLGLFFDRENNLWLGLDNGIDCIHLDSPLFSLYGNKSLIGSGYASYYYNGKFYLGTNQGLYVTEYPRQLNENVDMQFVHSTEGQVWALMEYDQKLFCSSDNGIFIIDANSVSHLDGLRGVWTMKSVKNRPDLLIAGTYNGLYLLKKDEGKWTLSRRVEGFKYSCKMLFAEDLSNVFWVANKERGIFRVTLSADLTHVIKVKNYNSTTLPIGNNTYISKVNNEIVISSREGLFRYNQIRDCLERFSWLEQTLGDNNISCSFLEQDQYRDIWYVTDGTLKLLRYNKALKSYIKNENESYLKGSLIEDFEHIRIYDDNLAVIGTEEGFSLLKFRRNIQKKYPLNLQIRKVYLTGGKDSLIYGRSFIYNTAPLVISYSNNSLRIVYSVNNYDKSLVTFYSCKLSGDREEEWSAYSENNTKEYTDLKEGHYTFSVKIITDKNKKPIVTSFNFEILPPWYRTWWVYSLYALVGTLLLCYIYYKIVESRKKLVLQKEQEIIKQKVKFKKESELKDKTIDSLKEENLQAELSHKSEELIRTTLNIVRKNEILQNIRKEALGISHSINEENLVSIRRKTLRLINQIDTNMEHDDDLQAFQTTFDSVHYDFFKCLEEQFPELNNKEKMLCAYIKMNLMSKEIAPLLNISVRGVEISRYRLRKKLNLGEKDNLAEFLQRLSK
ncbi:transcriptional regulator [uncultured Bacteroides sp.]|uniref:ligand-binding sensor domain-containing protein n=1 Tax=uncultured Bacteroides sp. TaxID=162156 RepID=UPI002AA79E15|nr:transcriptional regulator [uncultured Bacteroides sp.]